MKLLKTFIKTTLIIINLLPIFLFGQSTITVLTDMETRNDYAYSIAIQADRKVVMAGDAWGTPCLIRFNTAGTLDNTFGVGGKVFATWGCSSNPADNDIKIQSDGKIILGTWYFNGSDDDFIVARYNSNGTPDNSFGNNGQVILQIGNYNDWCNSIAIQPDGKILAGGGMNNSPFSNYNFDFAIIRLNTDGTIDNTFGNNGKTTTHIGLSNNIAYSIAIQQNGKIILAGEANDSLFSDFTIVRYNSDGSLDHSFGNTGIVRTALSQTYDFAKSVVLQSDDKIVVAGSAQNGLSNYNFAIVRYNSDGSLDNSFGANGIAITDIGSDLGNSVALQTDGKIILAGGYATGTIYKFATLRYNINGSLDNTFGTNGLIQTSFGSGESEGSAVAIGDDGEILIAGSYNHGSPEYFDFALARLFSNITVGIIDVKENVNNIIIYPNPIHSNFEINYTLQKSQEITITLKDIQGKIIQIFTENKVKQSGNHAEIYYLNSHISPNQYFIEMGTQDHIKTIKIIIQ